MDTVPSPVMLAADALVDDCPRTPVGAEWPLPVNQRLEELVGRARQLGERTSRRELLAAIVTAFDVDDDEFTRILRTYRTARVRDVALRPVEAGNLIAIERFRPGRRKVRPA